MPKRLSLATRFARVKLLLCDVDGVVTDGVVHLGEGKEFKTFGIQDGLGMMLLKRTDIKVGWVSARPSAVTTQRAEELKIDYLVQDKGNKVDAVELILQQNGTSWEELCFMGDDVVDLGVLKRAGVAVAVSNAIAEAKAIAHYVTKAHGGRGAVRETIVLILKAQRKWPELIRHFLQ
jgi:3-deoxy-D-manno-octulosonate 8-phosphate phosphatase (KDO 8-P phosphatase)